jgi:ABC-type dipeptide/oligopeptide/nickel transport system ATPase component
MASAPSVKHDQPLSVHQLRRAPADPDLGPGLLAASACVFAARCPFASDACAVQPALEPVPESGQWSAACHRREAWPALARERAAVAAPR